MSLFHPYIPCLNSDSEKKPCLRLAYPVTVETLCFPLDLTLAVVPQRKRMVVPAALKIVRLKPTRKVSPTHLAKGLRSNVSTKIWLEDAERLKSKCYILQGATFLTWQGWALCPETDHLLMRQTFRIWFLSQVWDLPFTPKLLSSNIKFNK